MITKRKPRNILLEENGDYNEERELAFLPFFPKVKLIPEEIMMSTLEEGEEMGDRKKKGAIFTQDRCLSMVKSLNTFELVLSFRITVRARIAFQECCHCSQHAGHSSGDSFSLLFFAVWL